MTVIAVERHSEESREHMFAEMVARYVADPVLIMNEARHVVWVNASFVRQTGFRLEDLSAGPAFAVLLSVETEPHARAELSTALEQGHELRLDLSLQKRCGAPFWADLYMARVETAAQGVHFIVTLRDITARKVLEVQNEEMRQAETLRQSERHLLALTSEWLYSANSYDELLMVIKRAMHTLIPEAEGALYVYNSARSFLELAVSWGTAPDFVAQMVPDDCWALRRGRAYAYGQKPIQFPCNHAQGPDTPYFCLPIIAHGETIGLLHIVFEGFEETGLMRHLRETVLASRWDVSLICAEQISLAMANVRLRQELQEQSLRDALTGLWNRRWLNDNAARLLMRAANEGREFTVVALDLDHFKSINDRFGHDAGDAVLVDFAKALRSVGQETLPACRIGGEEFLLLCPDHAVPDALAQVDLLRKALLAQDTARAVGDVPPVTFSAGIAALGRDGVELAQILQAADRALYLAKEAGRNCTITAAPKAARKDEALLPTKPVAAASKV